MSKPKWTPEPWFPKRISASIVRVYEMVAGIASPIADVLSARNVKTQEAYARLIAAAPEMAELLERVVRAGNLEESVLRVSYDAGQLLAKINGDKT